MLRLALIVSLLSTSSAMAQNVAFGGLEADRSAPVEVAADNLSVDQNTGHAVFTGNVKIGQGEMRLSAQEVTVEYANAEQSQIRSFTAKNKVTLVSGEDAAEADQAVYEVASGEVVLTGNVILVQGKNVLTGDRVRVDLNSGTANVDGRVRTILQTGGNDG